MGNKLCKKKVDSVDSPKSQPTPFDRIINRLHLKPKWKSDSHLEEKQVNRYDVSSKNGSIPQRPPRPLSNAKSSDWTDVDLEVPDDNEIKLTDPKLALIFNDNTTPTPPPRKHKKGIRERIEAVAKSGLQALQTKKPVDEPLCVKKTIIYGCPHDEVDHIHHNRDHKHERRDTSTPKVTQKQIDKESKRRKNLSVVSLPNYSDFKFTLANNGVSIDSDLRKSANSLPGDEKKTNGDKKDYISRCRSFGSSLPQLLLHKLSNSKAPLAEIESDDSFGGLEDWDLKIIEHYNPNDSSLPRKVRPQKTESEILSDIESLIVNEEDLPPPRPPVRRAESLVKKINRDASETAHMRSNEMLMSDVVELPGRATPMSVTPPPSPEKVIEDPLPKISLSNLPTKDAEGKVEHSSLMRILQEFSVKSAQAQEKPQTEKEAIVSKTQADSTQFYDRTSQLEKKLEVSKLTHPEKQEPEVRKDKPKLTQNGKKELELRADRPGYSSLALTKAQDPFCNTVVDFLDAERAHLVRENEFTKFGNVLQNVDPVKT